MIWSFIDRILFPIMHSPMLQSNRTVQTLPAGGPVSLNFLELSGESVALSTCELNSARVLSNPVHATQGKLEEWNGYASTKNLQTIEAGISTNIIPRVPD